MIIAASHADFSSRNFREASFGVLFDVNIAALIASVNIGNLPFLVHFRAVLGSNCMAAGDNHGTPAVEIRNIHWALARAACRRGAVAGSRWN